MTAGHQRPGERGYAGVRQVLPVQLGWLAHHSEQHGLAEQTPLGKLLSAM